LASGQARPQNGQPSPDATLDRLGLSRWLGAMIAHDATHFNASKPAERIALCAP
jgi:hypothetical protein